MSTTRGRRLAVGLERAGLGMFVIAAGCLLAAGWLTDYRLSERSLSAFAADRAVGPERAPAVVAAIAPLADRRWSSVRALAREAGAALDAGAARLSDYERDQLLLGLAREAAVGAPVRHALAFWLGSVGLAALGGLLCFLPRLWREEPGIRNDGHYHRSVTSRGLAGIALGVVLIGFYVALYFYPVSIAAWIRLADPLSEALRGRAADRWFFYGMLYTLAIWVMGLRMLVRYRHSRYHLVRTASVMFFQTGFAFLIPALLAALNRPEIDFKSAWPLEYSFFFPYRLDAFTSGGAFGWFVLLWGIGLALGIVPALAFLVGKRWYCSWVCGCGGLAETLGDPFRHLSDKRLGAWRVERWSVHGVLVLAVAMTGIVVVDYVAARAGAEPLFGSWSWRLQSWYGFLIGSIFAGVVGTGFYPLMGNRVWCRFGCPLAAILGLVQKYGSRFRITTNGGQCISCGNCSTYCEMGIDVRWYAQRGQNIVRSSCVGCGVCAAVCPRGVLRLENGPMAGRYNSHSLLQVVDGRIDAT